MIQVKSSEPALKKARMDDSSSQPETATGDDKCYVCDTTIVGKKYSLASCMTNGTKVRLVEVLGRLVCDNYMVVVSHADYICRGCANLLNTLDRLEAEISSVKRIVLNFVERKYKLGDKVHSQLTPTPVVYSKTVPTSPATNKTVKSYTPASTTFPKKVTLSPSVTKQASPAMKSKNFKINVGGQSDSVSLTSAENKVVSKTNTSAANVMPAQRNVWMQCNQCQYTTNQRAVMLEHLRQHVATKSSTTPAKTSTPQNKVVEPKTGTSSEVNGSPTTAPKQTKDKPSIMLTIDGKFAPLPNTSAKPTIIIKKSALVSSMSNSSGPGIVTKMLSSTKNTKSTPVTFTAVSEESSKDEVTKTIEIKAKPKEVLTPQVFTSVKTSGVPEPSMPLLLGEDDILSQTSPR